MSSHRSPSPITARFVALAILASCRQAVVHEPVGEPANESAAAHPTQHRASQASPLAVSLLGDELFAPPLEEPFRRAHEAALEDAYEALANSPEDVAQFVRVGRELAYLGRIDEAVEHYTRGLDRWPDEPHLLRHRGHRRLTLRQLGLATHDLSRAAELLDSAPDEVEPDGIPNARGEPRSTLKGNVWYHLGLALFCSGEYSRAQSAFETAQGLARNDDTLVACIYWRTLAAWRMGLLTDAEGYLAGVPREPDVIENGDYLELLRLFREERTDAQLLDGASSPLALATRAFGVAQLRLRNGAVDGANELYVRILDETPWTAFGHLAAEAELSRL